MDTTNREIRNDVMPISSDGSSDDELIKKYDKAYDRFREQVTSENDLYHKRLTWLATTQGFLIAATGLLLRARHELSGLELIAIDAFTFALAVMGCIGASISYKSIGHARYVLNYLRDEWDKLKTNHEYIFPDQMQYYPHPTGGKGIHQAKENVFRQKKLPLVFIPLWLLIITIVIYRNQENLGNIWQYLLSLI